MKLKFTKMHGTLNDFIFIDGFKEKIREKDLPKLAIRLCNRKESIGADAIIAILPSQKTDFRMAYFNADGSPAEMCGNGVRCFAKYVYEHKLTSKKEIGIETPSGIIKTTIVDNKTSLVKVDMGPTKIKPLELDVDGKKYNGYEVSIGNPHFVMFVENYDFDYKKLGKKIENHSKFPKKTNVEFVKVKNKEAITMRVLERGVGETFSCGTGACASAVACISSGKTGHNITVHLLGGDLSISWDGKNHVFKTGNAVETFSGQVDI